MKLRLSIIIVIVIIVVCSVGSSVLSARAKVLKKIACTEFHQQHPDYVIESAVVGEGDASAVDLHFRFRVPGDDSIHNEVWTFLKADSGTWKVTAKRKIEEEFQQSGGE